jgi:hypothetical protein
LARSQGDGLLVGLEAAAHHADVMLAGPDREAGSGVVPTSTSSTKTSPHGVELMYSTPGSVADRIGAGRRVVGPGRIAAPGWRVGVVGGATSESGGRGPGMMVGVRAC